MDPHGEDRHCCKWPGGCSRRKASGTGNVYCSFHKRIAKQNRLKVRREGKRKPPAAEPYKRNIFTKHDGKEHMEHELEEYMTEVRATFKAFGLIKW